MSATSILEAQVSPFRGLWWLLKDPKYMLLGAVPPLITGILLSGLLVALWFASEPIALSFTPQLEERISSLIKLETAGIVTKAVRAIILLGGAYLYYIIFTAATLAIGDPIYNKIAEAVEKEKVVTLPAQHWSVGAKDAFFLFLKILGVSVLSFGLGFIPVVGVVLAWACVWVIAPYLLAEELLSRTLVPRGIALGRKQKMLYKRRTQAWGFGLACQLLLMIPFATVIIMPAIVAGAALLADNLSRDDVAVEAIS